MFTKVKYLVLICFLTFIHFSRAHGHLNLTAEQKSCIQEQHSNGVHGPDAFNACGIQPPPHGGFFAHLTDDQKSCLKGQLGDIRASGTRPTREQRDAAFAACGIQKHQDREVTGQAD